MPTPIGNLGDITLRAIECLKSADLIAAEDTRHTAKLLAHLGIDRPLSRLDAHTIAERGLKVLARHEVVALVSDAGTPGISDPGAELVRLALQARHTVEALPGATAFVPALILSGLPTARFAFEGFLPRRGGARRSRLTGIAASERTTLLYEAPGRLASTLDDLAQACGQERAASVSRELTKLHEETVRGTLADIIRHYQGRTVKGEVVIVVGPAPQSEDAGEAEKWRATAAALAKAGIAGRTLQNALAALGAPRNLAYQLAMRAGG